MEWYFVAYLGEHNFVSEFLDHSDASGCSLLELDALESLVEVESVISASSLKFFLLSVFAHIEMKFYDFNNKHALQTLFI